MVEEINICVVNTIQRGKDYYINLLIFFQDDFHAISWKLIFSTMISTLYRGTYF